METELINPRLLKVEYIKSKANPFAMKAYFGVVGRPTSRRHRTATEALAYARRVFERWCRLYDAAVLALANGDEQTTENAKVAEPTA